MAIFLCLHYWIVDHINLKHVTLAPAAGYGRSSFFDDVREYVVDARGLLFRLVAEGHGLTLTLTRLNFGSVVRSRLNRLLQPWKIDTLNSSCAA